MVQCNACNGELAVAEIRYAEDGIYRKRICKGCKCEVISVEFAVTPNETLMNEWNKASRWRKDAIHCYIPPVGDTIYPKTEESSVTADSSLLDTENLCDDVLYSEDR